MWWSLRWSLLSVFPPLSKLYNITESQHDNENRQLSSSFTSLQNKPLVQPAWDPIQMSRWNEFLPSPLIQWITPPFHFKPLNSPPVFLLSFVCSFYIFHSPFHFHFTILFSEFTFLRCFQTVVMSTPKQGYHNIAGQRWAADEELILWALPHLLQTFCS